MLIRRHLLDRPAKGAVWILNAALGWYCGALLAKLSTLGAYLGKHGSVILALWATHQREVTFVLLYVVVLVTSYYGVLKKTIKVTVAESDQMSEWLPKPRLTFAPRVSR